MNTWFKGNDRTSAVGIGVVLLLAGSMLLLYWAPLRNAVIALAKYDAGLSVSITASEGGSQVTKTDSVFATPLQATVKDASRNPISGVMVMFSAPASGPSAGFGGVTTVAVASDRAGIAVAPPLTANGLDGSYTVTASVTGAGEAPAYFSLMNTPGSPQKASSGVSEAGMKRALWFDLVVIDGLCILAAVLYFFCVRLIRADRAEWIFSSTATIALSVSIFIILATFARDDYFAPLETLMTNPRSLPVYGQRLLVVWLADALKFLLPAFSYRRCYLATQLVATLAATHMIGRWAALIAGQRWKFVGQLLFVAMLIPTITYGTFYDIAMVCVYTTCLFFLYQKRYYAFVATLGVGTLNHENTLLLVPVAALVLWRVASRRISLGVPVAAFAAWAAARLVMQGLVPATSHFELHLWTNLMMLSHLSAELVKSFMSLAFWLICAAFGFRGADQVVRRSAILLPGLIAATFVAGRFVEARQFDAFIPLAIALILSHLNQMTGSSGTKRRDAIGGLVVGTLHGMVVRSGNARSTASEGI